MLGVCQGHEPDLPHLGDISLRIRTGKRNSKHVGRPPFATGNSGPSGNRGLGGHLLSHLASSAPRRLCRVDIFFVISGYLITGGLFREACSDGTISLLRFYARRVRRLLPAAALVLIVVASATSLLPETRWEETSFEIAASSIFLENWALVWLATEYLSSENAASPVQHYWSLSVEEQFYLVWPILIMAGVIIARRLDWSLRFTLAVALSATFAASLTCSIILTASEPEGAYFLTHTRIWELALGGLLALCQGLWRPG